MQLDLLSGSRVAPSDNVRVGARVICMCVIYQTLGDTLRMDFAKAFLDLWLRMASLEL